MSEDTVDAEVVYVKPGNLDSGRESRRSRRDEPSARKLRAARKYASGEAKSLGSALVGAGFAESTARNPKLNALGSVELMRVDLAYNPQPVAPAEMLRDGFSTLHTLATRGESEAVRGGAADKLIGRLTDAGLVDESSEITPGERFDAWKTIRQATRRGIRAGVRLVSRYGLAHALDVLAAHEEIEAARELRRTPAAAPAPAPHRYSTGPNE